jgi:AraC-like DNA-binding protein
MVVPAPPRGLNESAILGPVISHHVSERLPSPGLARHVSCVWTHEVATGSDAFLHRKSPTGSTELVCARGAAPRILGPRTGLDAQWLTPGTSVFGIRLRPEAAASLLGMPASELCDLDVDASEILGRGLEEAVEARGARAALLDAVARLPEPDRVAGEAVRRIAGGRVAGMRALAGELFISERQLRRRFEAATGLAPKTLHRILRYQRFLALAWAAERPAEQLARLAIEAGYADQSHLTREAARLQGGSPRALLLESAQRCNCGHDHSASYAPLISAVATGRRSSSERWAAAATTAARRPSSPVAPGGAPVRRQSAKLATSAR